MITKRFSSILAFGILFLVSVDLALAGCPPGIVLEAQPSQSTGAVGGGTAFKVLVGTTVGPATLSVQTKDHLKCYLDKKQFESGGDTILVLAPTKAEVGETLSATLTARTGSATVKKKVKIKIVEYDPISTLKPTAIELRDAALGYLREKHSIFANTNGLDKDVQWKDYAGFPQPMIVSYYHFRWGDWHIRAVWHVTTPPDNWKRVFLSNQQEGKYWAVEFDTNDNARDIPYQ